MTPAPEKLAARAVADLCSLQGARHLVALAGPPGAGKTTISAAICAGLNAAGRSAVVVPMDGFHLDNRLLEARGLLARKGAVESFDALGFCHLVVRIAEAGARGKEVVYPLFDRARDLAIAGAAVVVPEVEFVLFEGNYLLLDQAPWSGLQGLWTRTLWIEAPMVELQARLVARWRAEGLTPEAAQLRAEENDLANVRFVQANSRAADLVLGALQKS
nr:nucleoside/nucleotide kinase family protein [uncultured Celeribacter sp.]